MKTDKLDKPMCNLAQAKTGVVTWRIAGRWACGLKRGGGKSGDFQEMPRFYTR